jgi:hypothetical protein
MCGGHIFKHILEWRKFLIIVCLPVILLPIPLVGQTSVSTNYIACYKLKYNYKITVQFSFEKVMAITWIFILLFALKYIKKVFSCTNNKLRLYVPGI